MHSGLVVAAFVGRRTQEGQGSSDTQPSVCTNTAASTPRGASPDVLRAIAQSVEQLFASEQQAACLVRAVLCSWARYVE